MKSGDPLKFRPELFSDYIKLLQSVDGLCEKISGMCSEDIHCACGCSSCCMPGLTLSPLEAYYILYFRPELPEIIPETSADSCPFLDRDRCLIYELRPLVCRTQGFPLLYSKDDSPELSVCGKNFKEKKSVDSSCLVDMDRINLILAVLNRKFMTEVFPEQKDTAIRITMEEIRTAGKD